LCWHRISQLLLNPFLGHVCAPFLASSPAQRATHLQVKDGLPIVDRVYVNGHGPYRFLVDTGTNSNLVDPELARSIGMNETFQAELTSAAGNICTAGNDGNTVALDNARAQDQRFLFSNLAAIRYFSRDIQGVLGQWFLSRFDYLLDLRRKRLEFGKQAPKGPRAQIKTINDLPVLSTNLGDLILDSGSARVVLFGVEPSIAVGSKRKWRTVAGSLEAGMSFDRELIVGRRTIWRGDAVAIPGQEEPGLAGLVPLSLFKAIYVCNSEGYIIFK
jgi:predicted aspartyl protease